MKTFAFLLLAFSLVAGGSAGSLFYLHRRAIRTWSVEEAKHRQEAADWNLADRLQRHNLETQYENDQSRLKDDNLRVDIARLEGHSIAQPLAAVIQDEKVIRVDLMAIRASQDAAMFGPGEKESKATAAADLALERRKQAEAWITRDAILGGIGAFLLLCFGFAFALASTLSKRIVPNT